MTVMELIEELTEIDELDMIFISKNEKRTEVYEGEEIDFIDEETLKLTVKDYGIRSKFGKKCRYRIVDIRC